MMLDPNEKIMSFWCDICEAHIPCRSRKWRARRRRHAEVHERFAAERAAKEALAR